MKRRDFLKSALAASSAAGLTQTLAMAADAPEKTAREYYELRLYHLRRGPKQKLFDDFFRDAAIPAMNRIGLGPIGVFNVMTGPDSPTMYVLIPHKSLDSFATATDRVRQDAEYQKLGAEFINATAADPAYVRVESSLMAAFESIPKLEVPAATAEKKPRLFELRTYESHSKKANKKKVEMFNQGEIAIFRRTGLAPVFFGETLAGAKMPNLTYMLVFDDMAAHDKNWGRFVADPDWKKLSSTPGYTDPEIVSNISNLFLRPAPYSQI
jgi:NIPSNAP